MDSSSYAGAPYGPLYPRFYPTSLWSAKTHATFSVIAAGIAYDNAVTQEATPRSALPRWLHPLPNVPLNNGIALPKRWPLVLGLLIAALLIRFIALIWTPLVPEEAYYWLYSQHPSLSYYDHPPMVAWCIRLGTLIFGSTELGVRSVGCLLMLASSLLMYKLGKLWFSRPAALIAAISLQALPFYYGMGYIATMDAPLVFFWLLCLTCLSYALRHNSISAWYFTGLSLGAAALSKYTALFLGVGIVIVVIAHKPWRRHLRTPHPWLALLIAAACFSPVVIWNAANDWASFRFQLIDRFSHDAFRLDKPLWYIAVQLIILTPPLLSILGLMAIRDARHYRRLLGARYLFVWAFSLPLLALMFQKSLSAEVHLNWTAPAYLSMLPAIAWLLLAAIRLARRAGRSPWLMLVVHRTAIACLCLSIAAMAYLLFLQSHTHWLRPFGPWRQLAAVVEDAEDRLQHQTKSNPLVLGEGKYRLASVMAFYRTPLEDEHPAILDTTSEWIATGGHGLAFQYWMARADAAGRDCVIVTDATPSATDFQGHFDSLTMVDDPRLADCKPYSVLIGRNLHPSPPHIH